MKIIFLAINCFAYFLPGIDIKFATESLLKMSFFNLLMSTLVGKLFYPGTINNKAYGNLLSSTAAIFLALILCGSPLFMYFVR